MALVIRIISSAHRRRAPDETRDTFPAIDELSP
jgi:hypothetical protein